jgi:hypothetical protein
MFCAPMSQAHTAAGIAKRLLCLAPLVLGACGSIVTSEPTPLIPLPSLSPTIVVARCAPGQCGSPIDDSPTPSATLLPASTATQPAPFECSFFSLEWPIEGAGLTIDGTYRFGSTQEGQREPHHGVEIPSPAGTPVVAPAAGRVEFAGEDRADHLGPYSGFYGNVVVLSLDEPSGAEPIYLLFGHLSKTIVRPGQDLESGDVLGLVGSSGVAIGAHLHFEVRAGANRYEAVRNPELWLKPQTREAGQTGVLAGRVVDRQGKPAAGQQVTVRLLDGGPGSRSTYFLSTYELEPGTPGSDGLLGENFVLSGVPAGEYEVAAFSPSLHHTRVRVVSGTLTWVAFSPGEVGPECTR